MSTTEAEYSKRGEECLRLAGACIAKSNRQILLPSTGGCWPRKLRARALNSLNLTSPTLRAIAQEREARGVRTPRIGLCA